MIELNAAEIRECAVKAVGTQGRNGKGAPNYLNSEQEVVEAYRRYCQELMNAKYADTPADQRRNVDLITEYYTDISMQQFQHDLPALMYIFRRYLTQH